MAVESGQAPDDGDQRFLGGVESVGLLTADPPAQRMDPVVVPSEQPVEGAPVAGLSGGDELEVIRIDSYSSILTDDEVGHGDGEAVGPTATRVGLGAETGEVHEHEPARRSVEIDRGAVGASALDRPDG